MERRRRAKQVRLIESHGPSAGLARTLLLDQLYPNDEVRIRISRGGNGGFGTGNSPPGAHIHRKLGVLY